MATGKLNLVEMSAADHAFYGLVWAGTVLMEQVDRALQQTHNLPISWFEVMLWLSGQDEPVAVSVLGNSTMLSRSQVSRVLDALQARELIVRTPSARDARSIEVALTPGGHALFASADATRRACLAPVFTDVLTEEDLGLLGAVWAKLKSRGGATPGPAAPQG